MIVRYLCAAALLLAAGSSVAQSTPGWASPSPSAPSGGYFAADPPGPPPPPPPVPVDGGLGLLAVAGGALAVQRLRRRSV